MKKACIMFGLCGSLYVLLEFLFRGRSHVSMFFAGGLSATCIFCCCVYGKLKNTWLPVKCAFGSVIITLVELVTGAVVNLWLRLQVWDYSEMPFNLWGQICLPFSAAWFFLTLPILGFGRLLQPSKAAIKREIPASPSASGE